MNYRVIWVPRAEQELAELWLNAPNRDAVTRAAQEIDELLRKGPSDEGESRPRGRRILFRLPLAVVFTVQPQDHLVTVLNVWRVKKK